MEDENKKCCPNCSQTYQLKSATEQKDNIPLFLSCGHSMCENCIRNIIKFQEPVDCKVCQRSMEITSADIALLAIKRENLYEMFPVNLSMLGELLLQLMVNASPPKKKGSCFVDLGALLKNTDSTNGECMECHKPTTKMCKQCSTVLCDACFNKTHKNFIIFKNHVLQTIEPQTKPNLCKSHKGKSLDYFCKTCDKSICMDCLMVGGDKSCKNHDVVSMDEVNETFIEALNDVSPKVDETFRRLTKTGVEIGQLLHNIENETGTSSELTQILANVEQHFSKLTYSVQKHKQEVIDIIVKLKCSEKQSLQKAKDDVTNAIKDAKVTLDCILSLDKMKSKETNIAVLLEDAKRIAETPWYLKKDESNDPLKVAVNDDLCALINDYIHLEGNANSVYKLHTAAELPEGEEVPPPPPTVVYPPELLKDIRVQNAKPVQKTPPPVFVKEVPRYRAKSGSVSSLNSVDSDSSYKAPYTSPYGDPYQKPIVQEVQPFAETHHPRFLREGSQELIYVSHIVDPHNFFVQRVCHQGMVKEMLREFKNAANLPKPSKNHAIEGKMYLVYNKADNMWQRCRIIRIDRQDEHDPLYHVFCVDFGSTEVVKIDKLRLLTPARVQSPFPLAARCSLANCRPKAGKAWTTEDSYLIQKIIDNKQAIIHVRAVLPADFAGPTLQCDVLTYDHGTSLVHALAFHDRAAILNPRMHYPKISGIIERPKLFMNNSDYKMKMMEEVYITYIVSPDKFYVRKKHLQGIFEKLCEEMSLEYSLSDSNGSIYLPETGMVCAVNIEKFPSEISEVDCLGASWRRGVVLEAPGRGRVRVLLPDVGAEVLPHWTALRHLDQRFATLAALAVECYLSGVTPLNKKWAPGSVAVLQRFAGRPLQLTPFDRRRGALGATLAAPTDPDDYTAPDAEPVCINTLMIKFKFAIAFGLFMPTKENIVEDQVITNRSPLDVPKPRANPKTDDVKLLRRGDALPDEKALEAKDKGILRLEAKVLHYESPSLFYVALLHQQKVFNELFENIQKFYGKTTAPEGRTWAPGERCVAACDGSKTWRRAAVAAVTGNTARVFYTDFAATATIPLADLRELVQEFTTVGDAAIKCHMCGVVSANASHWPKITVEFLKELLDAYPRVFLTKRGGFQDNSMPVELWVYHTIQGGALEPNQSEWRCLNKKIIEQGLGLPDETVQIPSTEDDPDDDMLSFLRNVADSVHDYLQLEPVTPMPRMQVVTNEVENAESAHAETAHDNSHEDEILPISPAPSYSNTELISDWLPPEPLQAKEFTGIPTYVDNDGIIYMHTVEQVDTLDLIQKALDVRFKNPDPKSRRAKWNVGEPCVARYFLDGRFYRGRVSEVGDGGACLVHFIDYGNEETCPAANLRKTIALYQIPVQAARCVLARVRPAKDAAWPRHCLDYVHNTVVEKQCTVRVVGEPAPGVYAIELHYNKLCINDHLVELDLASYADGSRAVERRFAPPRPDDPPALAESDSGPDYIVEEEPDTTRSSGGDDDAREVALDWNRLVDEEDARVAAAAADAAGKFMTYPRDEAREFLCTVSTVSGPRRLELATAEPAAREGLDALIETVQAEAARQPALDGVYEHKACVARYPPDGRWYRAAVLQYAAEEARVKVRYVDYGNVEVVPLGDVRETRPEWARAAAATRAAAPRALRPALPAVAAVAALAEALLDRGPFRAVLHDPEEPAEDGAESPLPAVELFAEDGRSVFDELVEGGVYTRCSDPDVVD